MYDLLKQVPLFTGLSEAELDKLVTMSRQVDLQTGDTLLREGEPGDSMFVVLEGKLQVTKKAGESEVILAERGPGEVMGEMSVLNQAPRSATVRALAPSKLLEVNEDTFFNLMEASPSAARAILHTFAARLSNTEGMLRQSEKMASLGTLSAGIAHELNNPAAAARRAASQLRDQLAEVEKLTEQLDARGLTPSQRAALTALRSEIDHSQNNGNETQLDPLARADLESELQDWLGDRNIPDPWEVAPRLVALRLTPARLEELAKEFTPDELPPVLAWVAAQGNSIALLDEIGSSTERISDIVKAVKSYSYLDQAPLQEVDVHEGLENTLMILRHKLKRGITIHREYDRNLPRIQAFASELNQVWTNIIDNAIDAMQGNGELTIKTEGELDHVCVTICDNGPGMPPEVQARIFDAFYTTKPVGVGTGLGLHISYNIIVLNHKGRITVESQPGRTCFRVSLPVQHKAQN